MSGPTRIDLTAAVRTPAPAIAPALSWLCPVCCGKLHVFEGGRPARQEECQKCGSPLFVPESACRQIHSSSLAW
jgi:hypothetical protein